MDAMERSLQEALANEPHKIASDLIAPCIVKGKQASLHEIRNPKLK